MVVNYEFFLDQPTIAYQVTDELSSLTSCSIVQLSLRLR